MTRVSVIILNYNGAPWIERCLDSIRGQTIAHACEVIVADNQSRDGSDRMAEDLLRSWPNGRFIQNGANLGYCAGNNRGADVARGRYLFFLNNDTWLEPDCLEVLVAEIEKAGARAGTPLMLDYADNTVQSTGGDGFDVFGLMSVAPTPRRTRQVMVCGGCSFLIDRGLFREIGGFDEALYMYGDEYDLSWRLWIAGGSAVVVPRARLHHRGAANVNPRGADAVIELRTSAAKRYYTNRNHLIVVLKNARHFLLLLVASQFCLLALEALATLLWFRNPPFIRRAYGEALRDAWRMRRHVTAERRRIQQFRKRGDFYMLRFLRWRPNRWYEFQRLRQVGISKVKVT